MKDLQDKCISICSKNDSKMGSTLYRREGDSYIPMYSKGVKIVQNNYSPTVFKWQLKLPVLIVL